MLPKIHPRMDHRMSDYTHVIWLSQTRSKTRQAYFSYVYVLAIQVPKKGEIENPVRVEYLIQCNSCSAHNI